MGSGRRVETPNGVLAFLESELPTAVPPLPFPFDFVGGYAGYLGYELKAECGAPAPHRSSLPDAGLLFVDRFLAFDHEGRKVWLVAVAGSGADAAAEQWLDSMEAKLANVAAAPELRILDAPRSVRLLRGRNEYLRDIKACLAEIRDGESYEICLTNKVLLEADPDPWQFYRVLRRVNPVPYAAFLQFNGFAIACTSPERFLRIGADGWVESKPIKGTAPSSQAAQLLAASEKDRAENLMIVDLLRNDLGRVCVPGTVSVPKLMDVESYATLHQLVSTIRGKLRPECSAVDCFRAAFPGGSMTGAPKLRTMAILDKLETEARGVYSGAIGYFSLNGAVDLNVVIRTAVLTEGRVEIGTGGGIVALSEPEVEFAEMLLKAESVTRAMGVSLTPPTSGEMEVIYLR
jgi:para-aminobenzoate synthetase